MNIFELSSGLVSESDVISLNPFLHLQDDNIIDLANGARHKISWRARSAVKKLKYDITVKEWLLVNNLEHKQLLEILKTIDSFGGLDIRKNFLSKLKSTFIKYLYKLQGIHLSVAANRFNADALGVAKAVFILTRKVMYGSILLFIFGKILKFNTFYSLGFLASVVITLYFSIFCHEYAHVLIARIKYFDNAIIQRGSRVGVLHRQLPAKLALLSAIAGPVSGSFASFLIAFIFSIFSSNNVLIAVPVIIGLMHIASWHHAYGDGKTLAKHLNRDYHASAA